MKANILIDISEYDAETFEELVYGRVDDNQFTWTFESEEGIEVNIAQSSPIYFHSKPEGYKTRRYLGPFIPQMIGDTISVYMKVFWDAGHNSVVKDHYIEKYMLDL